MSRAYGLRSVSATGADRSQWSTYGGGDLCVLSSHVGGNPRRGRCERTHPDCRGGVVSLALDVIQYLESLSITQGQGAGAPWKLLPFQKRFVRAALAPGVSESSLSVGRGNGKSTLVSGLAAAALDGPLVVPRGEAVIVASSFDQARIDFEHVLAFLAETIAADRARWRIQDSANRASIEDRKTGARVRVLGSDPRRAHGLAPTLVIADEPSQWEHTTADRMLAALTTSLGKLPASRFVAIGTRPDGEHWFERMLTGSADYAQVHAARPDDPPFQLRTWKRSNPALDAMPMLLKAIRAAASKARKDSAMLPSFRALRLNQGISDYQRASLLSADVWQGIEGDAAALGPCVWGIDLGTSQAMSALSAYYPDTGRLDCLAAFADMPGLAERGLADGVGRLYLDMERRGELILTPGRVSDVVDLLREAMRRYGAPDAVAADRWREAELMDALNQAGVPSSSFVSRGQGFKDGAADVRSFRNAALTGKLIPVVSLMLRAAMRESVVVSDTAGNSKLAKATEGGRRARARDDAVAAAIMAVSVGGMRPAEPEREPSSYPLAFVG